MKGEKRRGDPEKTWQRGYDAALLTMLSTICRSLHDGDKAGWLVERAETVTALREVCDEFGDNEWDSNDHLADIVEKHLGRTLQGRASERAGCPLYAVFHGRGGYDIDKENARSAHLMVGRAYRVVGGVRGQVATSIVLEDVVGSWNSIMFHVDITHPIIQGYSGS